MRLGRHLAGCFAVLWLLAMAAGLAGPAAAAADTTVDGVSLWKQDAEPVAWTASPDLVYYNALGPDGMYEGYSAAPDGSGVTCLTCSAPSFQSAGPATQRGVSDVTSDGRYMLLEVENPHHLGAVGASGSEPGRGAWNDLWLASTDGSHMWQLTNVTAPGSGAIGTMWARFDPAGNKVVFAEMYAPAIGNLGSWRLVVADIVWNAGVPSLANQTVVEPATGLFMEPYGFSPDGSRVLFASNYEQPNWTDSQIWESNPDGTGLVRLSPADGPTGAFDAYNEFAFYAPSGNQIVYGRTVGSAASGLDYWLMNADGSGSQRLTYFNEPWSTESRGYATVGSLAFNPSDPNQFIAAVQRSLNNDTEEAVVVTLGGGAGDGLTAQFFSGAAALASASSGPGGFVPAPLATVVDDPSSGLEWTDAPAPGMSSTDFSVRWTGSIVPPATGSYTLCLTADDGARLYAGGALVIDGQGLLGQRSCGSVNAVAGAPLPVEVDYWHGQGAADIQLTWVPPGSGSELSATLAGEPVNWAGSPSAGEIIPAADLQPGTPPASNVSAGPAGTGTGSVPAVKPAVTPAKAPATATGQNGKHGGAVARVARAHKRKRRRHHRHASRHAAKSAPRGRAGGRNG